MTNDELRRRLLTAMGWTECSVAGPYHGLMGLPPGRTPDVGPYAPVPNPLESDRDAALLRAWCVGRGWTAELRCDPHMAVGTVRDDYEVILGQGMVEKADDCDPCRRERLALCRAVLQAIEATEVRP
jgi:hypothetical protein